MYSTPTDNFNFRKGYNFNAKRFCCSPKQRTFKRDAYIATYDLDNKLQTFGNKTIAYDNDGNMTSGPIIEGGNNAALEFNARGQLMGTGDVAYAYDLENTRTIVMHYDKNKILTQYRYVYNRVGNVPEVLMRLKLTNMTSQSTYYVYGAGLAYEVKITPDGREALRYYNYGQFRSTVVMTDSAQSITDRFHYDPWGYVLHSIGDSDTPFQFVGAYGIQTDPNGLINMRARYYNPVTKSFISQDPSGFDGGLNWYLYANGNPFSYIDIEGLKSWNAALYENPNLANTLTQNILNKIPTNAQMTAAELAVGGIASGGITLGSLGAAGVTIVGTANAVKTGLTTAYHATQYYGTMAANHAIVTAGRIATSNAFAQTYVTTTNLANGVISAKALGYVTAASAGFGIATGVLNGDNGNWTNAVNGIDLGISSSLINFYSVGNSVGNSLREYTYPSSSNYYKPIYK